MSQRGRRRRGSLRRAGILGAILAIAVIALVACGGGGTYTGGAGSEGTGGSETGGATANDGTLVVAIGADATGLDPESVMNNESGFVMSTIFDGLTKYKPGTTEVEPGLAESWDVAPDGLTYTFHLRKGVSFHDGTPFNAHTTVQWLDRLLDPNNPNYYAKRQGIDSYVDFTFHNVKSYEATDDHTLVVHMKQPDATLLNSLAMAWMGVTSPGADAKYGLDIYKHPVGTGPFKFVEWVPNDHITVGANPDYWNGAPQLRRIIFKVVPEEATRILMLQRGDADILADVDPADVEKLKSDPNVNVLTQPGLTHLGISLPAQTKPFNDVRVRQALNYAVNKDELNQYLYRGVATTMTSPMPPVLWGFNKDLKAYPYDPDKAKQLLSEAGYPKGFKATLYVYSNPRGYNPVGGAKLGEAVKEYLAKVGVDLDLQQLEWGAYLEKVRSKDFRDLSVDGWTGDNGDPDNFLAVKWATGSIPAGNTSHYSNPEVDRLLADAVSASDHQKRVDDYMRAQEIIWNDAPWIWINYTTQVRATSKRVHGFQLNPTTMFFDMEKVSLGSK